MRILMLTCFPHIWGPLPKLLPVLASTLRARGCEVSTEPWGRHREGESIFEKIIGRIGDIARVRRRCAREKFDMIIVHTTTEMVNYSRDIPVLWLCRRLVRHVVLHFHGSTSAMLFEPGNMAFKHASRILLQLADGVLVLSSEELAQWKQFYPQGAFFLTCNPFEPFRGQPAQQLPLPAKLPAGVPVLLYVGRLTKEKGIFDLLEAMVILGQQTAFHLLVAGGGPDEQSFRARIHALRLEDKVTLAGYLDAPKLQRAYQSADLFVFPSWREGFPTVITEAMAAGLPIVTTYIRGAADHLKEGVHACFVPPKSPAALAKAITRLLADPELRQTMSKANRTKVREFEPDIVGSEYLELLKQIAALKDSGPSSLPRQSTRRPTSPHCTYRNMILSPSKLEPPIRARLGSAGDGQDAPGL
jgi:glycosyltransferase involved in cell wall biosynthesis